MEEGEFSEARDNLDALEEDYRSAYDMGDDRDLEDAEIWYVEIAMQVWISIFAPVYSMSQRFWCSFKEFYPTEILFLKKNRTETAQSKYRCYVNLAKCQRNDLVKNSNYDQQFVSMRK